MRIYKLVIKDFKFPQFIVAADLDNRTSVMRKAVDLNYGEIVSLNEI